MLKKNRLLAITASMPTMESDVQDGKLFRERERVLYARLSNPGDLNNAVTADWQEQWQIKLPKTDNNSAKGTIRVRRVIPLSKTTENEKPVFRIEKSINTMRNTQYVLTAKVERKADDRLEVPIPASVDMFNLFKLLAENGMSKHRFHFPIEGTELVFEVDAFLKEDGAYHEWVKIDLELKDVTVDIPELPFKVEEVIYDKTEDPEQKKKISELYDKIFLISNTAQDRSIGEISQEGITDWIKDYFTFSIDNTDIAKVRELTSAMREVGSITEIPIIKKGASTEKVRFLFKNNNLVKNLTSEIRADINQLLEMNLALKETITGLVKIGTSDDHSQIAQAIKSIRRSTVIKLDNTKWLGNFDLKFTKRDKAKGRIDWSSDEDISPPELYMHEQTITDLLISGVVYAIDVRAYENLIKNINSVLKNTDVNDFKRAVLSSREEFDRMITNLSNLQNQVNRLKGHSDSTVRDTLRFARSLAGASINIAENYIPFFEMIDYN